MISWEEIKQEQAGYLYRAKVPTGWLVKHVDDVLTDIPSLTRTTGYEWTATLAFVPDPTHSWEV